MASKLIVAILTFTVTQAFAAQRLILDCNAVYSLLLEDKDGGMSMNKSVKRKVVSLPYTKQGALPAAEMMTSTALNGLQVTSWVTAGTISAPKMVSMSIRTLELSNGRLGGSTGSSEAKLLVNKPRAKDVHELRLSIPSRGQSDLNVTCEEIGMNDDWFCKTMMKDYRIIHTSIECSANIR